MRLEYPTIHITKNTPLKDVLKKGKIDCGECGHCCEYGSGYVLPHEIKKIAKHFGISEEKFKKKYLNEVERFHTRIHKPKLIKKGNKEYGRCVFYNKQEKCTIHELKPLHCKIGSCNEAGDQISNWFTVNYLVNPDDPQSVRDWDAHMKVHPTIPGGHINELVDKKILKKIKNYDDLKLEV